MILTELTSGITQAMVCVIIILGVSIAIAMICLLLIVIEYLLFGDQNDHSVCTDPPEYDVTPYEEDDEDNVIFNH
jgi:hypothetical protein